MTTEAIVQRTVLSPTGLQPHVQRLVDRFQAAGKRTITELLECAVVIAEAHDHLGKLHLAEFYLHIRLKEGSTAKKMRKVGENYSRLAPYVDRLPNNWTTLYHLVTLTGIQFQKLVDNEVLHPSVTLEDIKNQFRTSQKSKQKAQRLVIDLLKVQEGKAEFAKKLKSLLSEYKVLSAETQGPTLDQFIKEASGGQSHA